MPRGFHRRTKLASRVLAACAAGLWCCASAAETVTFRPRAEVRGPAILLRDVADIDAAGAEALSALEVAPAPLPGSSRRLPAGMLAARVRNSGLAGGALEFGGADAVEVTTARGEMTSEALAQSLDEFISANMPWEPGAASVEVEVPRQALAVPAGAVEVDWRAAPDFRYLGTGTFRGVIRVDGKPCKAVVGKATVEAYADVVVAAKPIERGQVIGADDVQRETRALSQAGEGPVLDPGEAVGRVARAPVAPGQVLAKKSLAAPILVKRKQLVAVELASGGLRIRTQAQAAMDGAEGDTITCINLGSQQAFAGVVRRDGVVVVP